MIEKKSQLIPIGTTEFIDLPDLGIFGVPAKVDTGADSSAIWASDIRMEDGVLSFKLFAPSSAYFTNEEISVRTFKMASVKNSFGHAEFRYKVRVKIQLGKWAHMRWVTLADRSRSTYPILLGKNFLRNNFVVDVSKRNLHINDKATFKVLVLTGNPSANQIFFDQVGDHTKNNVAFDCIDYDKLWYVIDGAETRVISTENGSDLASYRLVYIKARRDNPELAYAVAEYLRFAGSRFIDKECGQYVSMSKLSEYMKLNCYGLPVPKSIAAKTSLLQKNYETIVEAIGSPFVLKEISSDRGKNNYLVSTKENFKAILRDAPPQYVFIAQQYIENEGFYRVNILGDKVSLIVWRGAVAHQDPAKAHLNKPANGMNAKKVSPITVDGELRALALRAAAIMQRQLAGIDIVQDVHTKKYYILEANNAPQLRGGLYHEEKVQSVAKFFDKELNR